MILVEEKKNQFFNYTSKRYVNLPRKQKNLIDKIHKLIVKEFKLDVHHHMFIKKRQKFTTFFKSNNAW
jgi:hypothetical protein